MNAAFQQLCDPGPCVVQELWAPWKNRKSFNLTSLFTLLLSCLVCPCWQVMFFGTYSSPNYCSTVQSCPHCSRCKCQIVCVPLCCFCVKFPSAYFSGSGGKKFLYFCFLLPWDPMLSCLWLMQRLMTFSMCVPFSQHYVFRWTIV